MTRPADTSATDKPAQSPADALRARAERPSPLAAAKKTPPQAAATLKDRKSSAAMQASGTAAATELRQRLDQEAARIRNRGRRGAGRQPDPASDVSAAPDAATPA
ncbi:MAG: hypothetical protein AAFQ44_10095, partial [Pseudomonadota bacterium]